MKEDYFRHICFTCQHHADRERWLLVLTGLW